MLLIAAIGLVFYVGVQPADSGWVLPADEMDDSVVDGAVLPGDAPVLRGVDVMLDDGSILETSGSGALDGTATSVVGVPVKTGPIVDKVAV